MPKKRERKKNHGSVVLASSPYVNEVKEEGAERKKNRSWESLEDKWAKVAVKFGRCIMFQEELFDEEEDDDCSCLCCNELFSFSTTGESWFRCTDCEQKRMQVFTKCPLLLSDKYASPNAIKAPRYQIWTKSVHRFSSSYMLTGVFLCNFQFYKDSYSIINWSESWKLFWELSLCMEVVPQIVKYRTWVFVAVFAATYSSQLSPVSTYTPVS
jgi:hypothetical protein